jgi:hypothetical protein
MTDPFPPARASLRRSMRIRYSGYSAGCLFANYGDNVTPPGTVDSPIPLAFPALLPIGMVGNVRV